MPAYNRNIYIFFTATVREGLRFLEITRNCSRKFTHAGLLSFSDRETSEQASHYSAEGRTMYPASKKLFSRTDHHVDVCPGVFQSRDMGRSMIFVPHSLTTRVH